jgi:hypothetical protein
MEKFRSWGYDGRTSASVFQARKMVARGRFSRKRFRHQISAANPAADGDADSGIGTVKSVWLARCVGSLLGAAGRAGSTHIMQLRPVGIEGAGEELAPELADFGQRVQPSLAGVSRGAERARSDHRHDDSCLFSGGLCRTKRFLGRWQTVSGANY